MAVVPVGRYKKSPPETLGTLAAGASTSTQGSPARPATTASRMLRCFSFKQPLRRPPAPGNPPRSRRAVVTVVIDDSQLEWEAISASGVGRMQRIHPARRARTVTNAHVTTSKRLRVHELDELQEPATFTPYLLVRWSNLNELQAETNTSHRETSHGRAARRGCT